MAFTFAWAQSFVQSHGYFLIFLIMVIEGPMITTAAAFAASLGYFNVWIILLLSIMGDVVGDAIYFQIGRVVRRPVIERYGRYVGLSKPNIKRLEFNLKKSLGMTLFVIKMTPIAGIGILLAGALKTPWRRFLPFSIAIIIPRAIFFTSLGFFFGWAVNTVLRYFAWGEYSLLALVLFVVLASYLFQKLSVRIRERYG